MRSLLHQAAVLLLIALLSTTAQARRLALVIGNDHYAHASALENARNDASAVAQAFQKAGFTVSQHQDLGRDALFSAVESFALGVAKDDEVVVFYAGHGVQIDAAPYLLPTDIRASTARQVARDALPLESLLTDLSKARYALIVIDACRNNPFASQAIRSLGPNTGLQPIEPPEGMAVIFSAGRGQAALDNLGRTDTERHGVFTREFLRQMQAPGVPVRDLLLKVRDAVEQQAASVNHKQRPALIDESRGQFYFYPPVAKPAPGRDAPRGNEALAVEVAYWNSVKESTGPQELELYLRRYPQGQFADLAQARLQRLKPVSAQTAAAAASASSASASPAPSGPGDSEARRLLALANKGNAAAMASLGVLYVTGRNGLPRSDEQGVAWYRRGVEGGSGRAMARLGFMYERGRGGLKQDYREALRLYRAGIDLGDGLAMLILGDWYSVGRGEIARDAVQALAWYRQAAQAGESQAMANIGVMYDLGRGGLARDDAQAQAWWRRAADAGNGMAMSFIGSLYENGRGGMPKDDVQAVAWYRKGADARDGRAMTTLGTAYAAGRGGLPRDDVQAVEWHRKAIDAGAPRALVNMGFMMEAGRGGLPKDEAGALALYRKAAEQSDSGGMNALGNMYANGRGGLPKDDAQALAWYRKAADLGSAPGMFNLAAMLAAGRGGVAPDLAAARRWYELAAALGNGNAKTELAKMK